LSLVDSLFIFPKPVSTEEATMTGRAFARAKYFEGIPEIGKRRISIKLVADTASLTLLRQDNNRPLLSIPWPNIRDIKRTVADKNWIEREIALWVGMLPFMEKTGPGGYSFYGFWISFWDEEVQRDQKALIGVPTERRRDELINTLWRYRDQFHREIGGRSGPQRR
jgi:hypothetical protein